MNDKLKIKPLVTFMTQYKKKHNFMFFNVYKVNY